MRRLGISLLVVTWVVLGCEECRGKCEDREEKEECLEECECEDEGCDEECREMCEALGPGWGQTGCMRHCGCLEANQPKSEYDPEEEEEGEEEEEDTEDSLFLVSSSDCYLTCTSLCVDKRSLCASHCLDTFCRGYRPPSPNSPSLLPWSIALISISLLTVYAVFKRLQFTSKPTNYARMT